MSAHGMRPFKELLSKEDALARLLAAARPIARVESVPLPRAAGRVSAEDVRAPFDVPGFARSMMDGYAVRSGDAGPRRVVGEVFAGGAGSVEGAPLRAGEAMRIATGAPLPEGADAVVRVEDTEERDGVVTVRAAIRPRQSVEPAGSDLAKGDLVLARAEALTPARVGLLASLGRAEASVLAKPRVAIVSTGDELLRPGEAPSAGRIFDSNGVTLATLFEAHGAQASILPRASDSQAALEGAFDAECDLLVFTGGASAGAKDLVVDALRARGEVLFHGVRVKPGKPLLVGRAGHTTAHVPGDTTSRVPRERLVIGLPGNPTSALSNACLFVVPALRQMAGLPASAPRQHDATLTAAIRGEPDRFLFLPVKIEGGQATPTFKGSGALTSMAASDGWIGVPEGADLPAGSRVVVHAWW